MTRLSIAALTLPMILAAPTVLAENPMRPGLYQTSVQMNMPGMPAMPGDCTTRGATR